MSERKPPGVSWQSWIERQIDEGRKDGAFDDLEGHGQPIADLERPHDDLWWVKAKLREEDVVATPPAIAIRMERDNVVEAALHASSAAEIRAAVEDLNERIREVNRRGTWGPPTNIGPLDPERIIERWRTEGLGAHLDTRTTITEAATETATETDAVAVASVPSEPPTPRPRGRMARRIWSWKSSRRSSRRKT